MVVAPEPGPAPGAGVVLTPWLGPALPGLVAPLLDPELARVAVGECDALPQPTATAANAIAPADLQPKLCTLA